MPPVNSPTDPASPQTAAPSTAQYSRPLTPLSYFSSPVPDLAATLGTVTAAATDDTDVSFLHSSPRSQDLPTTPTEQSPARPPTHTIESPREPRRPAGPPTASADRPIWALTAPPAAAAAADNLDDPSRRERLQRVLARLNRLHDPSGSSTLAYSNRTPSPRRQSLYDWAPSHDENPSADDGEIDRIVAELRHQDSHAHSRFLHGLNNGQTSSSYRRRERDVPAASSHDATSWTDTRDRHQRERERRRRESEWMSLRSRAVLQRVRQEGSHSSTDRVLRYVMDRERSGMSEEEERARGTGWFRPPVRQINGGGAGGGGAGGSGGGGGGGDERRNSSATTGYPRDAWPLPPPAGESRTRATPDRTESDRRPYQIGQQPPRLPRISTPTVPSSPGLSNSSAPFLENAFKYLDALRSCHGYEDALSAAIDHGLATKEFFADKHDDFVMDLEQFGALPTSSWLQAGTVFDGHQHAMNSSNGLLHSSGPSSASTQTVEQINPNYRSSNGSSLGFDHPSASTRNSSFDASRPWLSHRFTSPFATLRSSSNDAAHDHWPVRVIIHAIDPDKMILQGTMEAYDVPQHPNRVSVLPASPPSSTDRSKSSKKSEPITTYLEGHIIDLTTHSFVTPSSTGSKKDGSRTSSAAHATPSTVRSATIAFPAASAHTDANNWRKLPPFSSWPADDDTARTILSKARMDEIRASYIFMRWKERCFIHSKDDTCSEADRYGDQDRGHGLTISGFYYISMRRSDGHVEGLYFDPSSTLYQHLRLKGRVNGWPAVEFR